MNGWLTLLFAFGLGLLSGVGAILVIGVLCMKDERWPG